MEKKILAVTACPTGIAHTYMAAEALQKAAAERGVDFKVETRGALGIENELTEAEINSAHCIIVAAAVDVDEARFAGKQVLSVPIGDAIKNADALIEEALNKEAVVEKADSAGKPAAKKAVRNQKKGPYQHLMNGVSYMLPLVVAGGLIIAISFIFGIEAFKEEGTLAAALMTIGGGSAFALMVPILAGFIAYSIAEKPGLAPGLVGGMLASSTGAGFLGGIVAGFLAGYTARWLRDVIKLPKNFEGLKPILILPFLSTLIVGLLMIYVVGTPAKAIMDALTNFLTGLSSGNAVLLGLLLGAMMAVDMGGPVNKAAYTFSVGLLGANVFGPMAAVMAAGMVPPLAVWLATKIARNKFTQEEQNAGNAAGVLGLSFITEGAIPFAAADPIRVIPAMVAGSAVTGALSMLFGSTLRAPHGGVFVLAIPNAVGQPLMYALAILAGVVVSGVLLAILKKKTVEEI